MSITPVMRPEEIDFFKQLLKGVKYYLEFGVGGTTVIVAQQKTINMTCIDSDKAWIDRVSEDPAVKELKPTNRIVFSHVDVGPTKEWGIPVDDSCIRKWPNYYIDIWRHKESLYDFIFIDGRFRIGCALAAAVFAKDGAKVAIHDYPDRPFYYRVIERYYDFVANVGLLYVFKRRNNINIKTLYFDIIDSMFNYN